MSASLVIGTGAALAMTPATNAIIASLPRAKQGVAPAVNDTARELGAAFGIAVLGSAFNIGYRHDIERGVAPSTRRGDPSSLAGTGAVASCAMSEAAARRLRRLAEELSDSGLRLEGSAAFREMLVHEIDDALRPPAHERRRLSERRNDPRTAVRSGDVGVGERSSTSLAEP